MKKKLVIDVKELPLRPKKLSLEEIAGVYGGCTTAAQTCSKNEDCCSYGTQGPMGSPTCIPHQGYNAITGKIDPAGTKICT